MSNQLTLWSDETITNIKKLSSENKTATEISKILNIERKKLIRFCKKQNICLSKGKTILTEYQENIIRDMITKGFSLKHISNTLSIKERTISHFCWKNLLYINVRYDNNEWDNDQLQKLKELNSQNINIRDIARILRKRTETIKRKLLELGCIRKSLKKNLINKSLIKYNQKHCWTCDTTQSLDNFYTDKNLTRRQCKNCAILNRKKKHDLLKIDNYKTLLYKRFMDSKFRAKKIKKEFNITFDYLLDLYNKQKGLCYYTHSPLIGKINDRMSISVDRLDSNHGYIEGNIVLCGKIINSMKSDLTLTEFFNILHQIKIHI